jgi:hypothetical protein
MQQTHTHKLTQPGQHVLQCLHFQQQLIMLLSNDRLKVLTRQQLVTRRNLPALKPG